MKNIVNKWLSDWWVLSNIWKGYWRFLNEQERPVRDVPTKALELYLEKMDGQTTKNDLQLKFLNICRFEWHWRNKN